jgi:hypothetical protein
MTESGKFIEIQGTAEDKAFSRAQFNEMVDLAEKGLKEIFAMQRKIINGNFNNTPRTKRMNPAQGIGSIGDALDNLNL